MDGCVVVQLMFTAAILGINEVSSDGESTKRICDNKSRETCCYNLYFDESTKQCVECPLGSFGVNCKRACVEGYYGYLCKTKCDCNISTCDPVTGCQDNSIVEIVSTNSTEDNTCDPITGCMEHSINESSNNSAQNTLSQEMTSVHSKNTRSMSVQTTRNPIIKDHHDNQIWMFVSFLLVGSLGTALIAGVFMYSRKLGWCKSSMKYPYLAGENATAGHSTEDELDEQPMGAMCAVDDDSDVYDEIRNSFLYNCSNSWADAHCEKGGSTSKREPGMSENLYSGYNDEGDYSYLQLKKRRSSGFKMFSLPKSDETSNKQEEYMYVSLKSPRSDGMDETTQNGKGRCKTLDRIPETEFNLPTQDRKFTYSLVGCASGNNSGESNKDALHAAPETSEESPMTSTYFEGKPKKEERPYSLVNLLKINNDS